MRVVHSLGFDVTVIAVFPSLDGPQGSPSFFDEQKNCLVEPTLMISCPGGRL